jgi:two-component system, sensor histidine kinase and response regulator
MSDQEREPARPSSEVAEGFGSLGRVAGELIHDLANVVAVVHGRAALALGDARAGRPPTAELERLVEASEDMSGMLRDVLEVLRGARLSPEVRFDPVLVIERTVRRFLDAAPPIEIRLVSSIPAGTMIPGRASFLGRAVLNLLNNAARFARSEIRITLASYGEDADEVSLLVEDDGPGIAPALLPAVFRPLVRGDCSTGSGLGLSSVAWAIQQLGGDVRYRSDALLGGAAFEIQLPAVRPRTAVSAPRLDLLVGCRLVLIEDDPAIQRALMRLLGRLGAEVSVFNPIGAAEEEILQTLLTAVPDAVLLDLRLGTRRGGEIWRALNDQFPALARRVVFVSALAPGDREWEEANATGQPILAKPLDVVDLAAALAVLLEAP